MWPPHPAAEPRLEVGPTMRVNVGCEFVFDSTSPTPLILQVLPRTDGHQQLLTERCDVAPVIDSHEYVDSFGNRCLRLTAPEGTLTVRYDALVEMSSEPDPVAWTAVQLPVESLCVATVGF
jgi:hypothetical protein